MIKKGQEVVFKPEFQDPGDENVKFVAIENEDGGRVLIEAQIGLAYNPTQVVSVSMIKTD